MHVHLIAVCGTGMGSLAGLLKGKGFAVSGSDQNTYPPMSTELEALGIKLYTGFKPENLASKPDLVIVGNAVSKNNPEVEEMLRLNIPYLSMPQALGKYFLEGKQPIVIAGTHGKTTTSALLAHLLTELGADPSYLYGGISQGGEKNYRDAKGEHFVIEGDEYDTAFFDKGPKFLHYQPTYAIITSLEFDHADIYKDLDHLSSSFENFIKLLPKNGLLLACNLYPRLLELLKFSKAPVQTYGIAGADWNLSDLKNIKSPLAGRHNALNLLACFALLRHLRFSPEKIQKALSTFKGVKRRQEVRGTAGGIIVIDDFAHHPTAIRETISAIKEKYTGVPLWAVFEPRSNTSIRAIFQKEFSEAFKEADRVILADAFNTAKVKDGKILDVGKLVQDISAAGTPAQHISGVEAIVSELAKNLPDPSVVLIMSNGGFGGIHEKLLTKLYGSPSSSPA